MARVDAVVVGAGAMGSAAAWWLARRGRNVVVVERFGPGHRHGASHGSSRIFRLAYPVPDYVRLAERAVPLWRELEDEAGETLMSLTGGVDHGDYGTVRQVAEALDRCGIKYEELRPAAASERWPGLRFEGTVVYQPDAAKVDADATVAALQRRAEAHGAEIHFGAPVRAVGIRGDEAVVRTEDDEWQAPSVVVTVGAWTAPLVGGLLRLPRLEVTREQVFHFRPLINGPWPVFIHAGVVDRYGVLAPEGVKVAEHHTGAVIDPDHRDFDVDPVGEERVRRYVAEWVPGVDPTPLEPTTCLYTTTPMEDFVLDRRGPLIVATGFSGHGFKFVPLLGRFLADLVTKGGEAPLPRFALPS